MKNLIDYASQDNGTEFRAELYAAIHDKVSAHIESKKQEIASGFMGQNEEYEEDLDEEVELEESILGNLFKSSDNSNNHHQKRFNSYLKPEHIGKYKVSNAKELKKSYVKASAVGHLKEEYESLDELSTSSYTRYISRSISPGGREPGLLPRTKDGHPKQKQQLKGLRWAAGKEASAGRAASAKNEEYELEESTDWSTHNAKVSARKSASPEELHAEFKKHANNPGHPNFKGNFSDDSHTGGKTSEQKAIGNIAIGMGKADKHNYAAKIAHFVTPTH